jgi:transcription elongation factor GreA
MARYLTREGLEKLKKELAYLESTKRKELAKILKHAISFGDLKENAAYHEAKDAQGFLEGRISELKEIVGTAQMIEKNNSQMSDVQIGSTVVLESENGKEKFQVVGPDEADILNGKISYKSPLGEIILGKKKGETAILKNSGEEIEYKIIKVE